MSDYSNTQWWNGTAWVSATATTLTDAIANSSPGDVGAYQLLYNGVTWERARTSKVFRSASATDLGPSAVWTPSTGKKFRLMKCLILVTSDAATAGGARVTIDLLDNATSFGVKVDVYCPAVAGTAFGNGFSTGWIDIGNGRLSIAANNVLNVNLSAALSSGVVRVIAAGCEE